MAETGTGAAGAQTGAQIGAQTGTQTGASGALASANTAAATGANGVPEAGNASTGSESGKSGTSHANSANSDVERLIQSAVDRATQRLGTDNKGLRERIAELERKGMSDDERHKAEMDEREQDLARRETELKAEKNRMYALTAIKNANLDDGGTTALELVDLVMADDEKGINSRVKTLEGLVSKLVQAEVDKTFRDKGRSPGKGTDGTNDKNEKAAYARELGKRAAAESQKARKILDLYTGGKR